MKTQHPSSAFAFDSTDSRECFEKHGIDFVAAQELWNGPVLIRQASLPGEAASVVGMIGDKHWTVSTHFKNMKAHIQSVRPSDDEEVLQYKQFLDSINAS